MLQVFARIDTRDVYFLSLDPSCFACALALFGVTESGVYLRVCRRDDRHQGQVQDGGHRRLQENAGQRNFFFSLSLSLSRSRSRSLSLVLSPSLSCVLDLSKIALH